MSQPEDGDTLKKLRAELRSRKLAPRPKLPAGDPTPLEEQVQIMGQLAAKLQDLGVSARGVSRLRRAAFRPKGLELSDADREVLATPEGDETLYRLQQAARSAHLHSRAEDAPTPTEQERERRYVERIEEQDRARAEYMRQRREGQAPGKR